MQALSSGSRRAGKVVRIGARVSGVSAPLIAAAAIFAGHGCAGEEFCAEGSYECTTAGSSGSGGASSGGSSSGSSGQASGGFSAEAGNAALGGSSAAGSGGDSGSASGGFAGTAEGGSSGSGDSGAGGDSGSTGTGGTSGNPVPCTLGDFSEGCTLASSAGLFVSPAGNDDNDGSSDAPLATLTAAIEKARSGSRVLPIFLCTATYREHPEIHNDGYALHGGFACPDDLDDAWVYDSAERAKIAPSTQGYALRVRDLQGLVVSDLEFSAADGEAPGESSIGVFVSNAVDVRFERVRITAGDGVDGAPGVVAPFEYREQAQLGGNSSTNATGGAVKDDCACQGVVTTIGGQGGLGGAVPQNGSPGAPASLDGGHAGETARECSSGGGGGDGTDAAPTEPGPGAQRAGDLDEAGWLPGAGEPGAAGAPGQGGGGGAGKPGTGLGGGGGGACGGCGGNGASGGRGGGASIALLAVESEITLLSARLVSSSAGHGGQGIAGQEGQPGGIRGDASGAGCDGGNGGKGADGGASGGGAGGVSVGILWSGDTAPDVSDDTTIEPGEAGRGGTGGDPLENDGIGGVSEKVLRLNG